MTFNQVPRTRAGGGLRGFSGQGSAQRDVEQNVPVPRTRAGGGLRGFSGQGSAQRDVEQNVDIPVPRTHAGGGLHGLPSSHESLAFGGADHRVRHHDDGLEDEEDEEDEDMESVEEFDESVDRFEHSGWRPTRLNASYYRDGCAWGWERTGTQPPSAVVVPGWCVATAILQCSRLLFVVCARCSVPSMTPPVWAVRVCVQIRRCGQGCAIALRGVVLVFFAECFQRNAGFESGYLSCVRFLALSVLGVRTLFLQLLASVSYVFEAGPA